MRRCYAMHVRSTKNNFFLHILKGTRLNEARYFRVPLPHTRKRMTMIHVIPRVSDSEPDHFRAIQVTANPRCRTARDCGKTIESKQSSVEMALVTCHGFGNINQNKKEYQDICLETEVSESSSDPLPSTKQKDIPTIIQDDSGKSTEFPQEENDQCRQTIGVVCKEKLRGHVEERGHESVDRKQNCGDRVIKIEKEKRCNSWWKDGRQTILHFFAKILGKRVSVEIDTNNKRSMDRVSPVGKRVKRVSRGGKNQNRKGIKGIRLKRVDNDYIVTNHVHRNARSRKATAENKSHEEQHHPSILVRQIQRTRDKNLRIMLLERELRIRSSKKGTHLTTNGINIRQLSSPLC
ncbi:uncharacterized protein [Anoplolepis gracilipes]|uniref:uncharacterized protein n=1 Tax=Anoplolepis gracilipes TaxID=354296 RepID=UPI003BA10F83